MLDNTSDFKSLICFLILIIVIYSLYKKNYIILTFSWSFTSYSLGGGDVLGIPFARYYLGLLYLFFLYFLLLPNNKLRDNRKLNAFSLLLIIIIIKIIIESLIEGINEFRSETLIIAFHVIFLSLYIFQKSFDYNGFNKTINDFILSGLFLHGTISIILFYPIFQNQFLPALGFGHRITIFNQDTINSAKPFYFYIIFLLAAIHLKLISKKYLIIIASVIGLICLLITLLNGSRQFAIGLAIVAIFPYIKLNLKTYIISGILLIILPFASTIIENNFSNIAIIERFSNDEIERENEEGRSSIWKTGFNRMFDENPILGLGFRNYGIVDDVSDANNPNVVIRKDNAHGFFQEVFIEHGVILGLLLLLSFLFSFFELRSYLVSNISLFNSIYITLIGFIIPNFFTGYIMSSMGYYFLGLFLYNYPKLSLQK